MMMKRRWVNYDERDEIIKGPWKSEEDEVLLKHVKKYGPKDWSSIRSKGLLQRTGKSCRLRWVNKLRPGLRNGVKFSAEEERKVIDLQSKLGNKWALIATYLAGRTDNDVKNFWSSRQKRLKRILHQNNINNNGCKNNSSSKPSSSKSKKGNTLEKSAVGSENSIDVPTPEAPKISSSAEEELVLTPEVCPVRSEPAQFYDSSSLYYNQQLDYNDFPLPLDWQDLFPKLADPTFRSTFTELESLQFPMPSVIEYGTIEHRNSDNHGNVTQPDTVSDVFPPMDLFDSIESLPSLSKWARFGSM